ncbi:MAG: HlyD family efflux transporter periplasmic adaptor subunit [Clostridia bacterium]|nr:HlyD family efflux transporter periplasmic adaptor subunit [Clostridia bacterium]
MRKSKKSTAAIIAAAVVIIVALIAFLIFIKTKPSSTQNVYQVSDLTMSSSQDSNVTKGTVTNNMSQTVKLEGEEKVGQVYVALGDRVSIGDKLFTYDLKSLELELKNKQLAVEKANVNIYGAQKELEKLKKTEPIEDPDEDDEYTESETSDNQSILNTKVDGTMKAYQGNGTKKHPYTYLVASGATITANYMKARCIERPEKRYEVLEYREDNKKAGVLIYKILLVFKMDGTFDFSLSQTEDGFNIDVGEDGSYTKSQLGYAINQKQIEISNFELDKQYAQAEYNGVQNKIKNSTVYASVDGVVKTLEDSKQAKTTGEPFIQIIGKSGYYVQGYISELQLAQVQEGAIVTIKSIAENVNCKGKIIGLSPYPGDVDDVSNAGNDNVSYYPFIVSVSAAQNLKIGDEVEINFNEKAEEIHYILKSFVLRETGGYYVYMEGTNGALVKQRVETGMTLYGEYIEITSGIEENDWLAFPYTKGIQEGDKTKHSTQQELFGDMY